MKKEIHISIVLVLCSIFLFVGGSVFDFPPRVFAAESAAINATIKVRVCGNNIKETGEQCDNADLGGASCSSLGYVGGGELSCSPSCDFNISACISSSGGGGGGGSSGGNASPAVVTQVNFSGRAYPKSTITLLKDAQAVATTIAGADANFQISLSDLAGGNYIFSVYGKDSNGVRSSLLTFPINVASGVTTNVSGIFISPTIVVDKSMVKRGDSISISGQSVPNSDITVLVNSNQEFLNKTVADINGIYSYNFNTSVLNMGKFTVKSKAALNGEMTAFSKVIGFVVGTENIFDESSATTALKGDFNSDVKINLIDFSIAAFWYKKSNPPAKIDLNDDGIFDLVDFSIMAFHWTG